MNGEGKTANKGPRHRNIEFALAGAIGLFGVIVMIGALQAGIGWGFEGPRAGFFPFYIGLLIIAASLVNLWQVSQTDGKPLFADWHQLRQVVSVALPTAVYVVAIAYIGIYVSSALLIVYFMIWLSGYGIVRTAFVAIGVPLITFLVFERWFLVALPKGPLERMLGY